MAKGKVSRQPEKPEKPAAPGPTTGEAAAQHPTGLVPAPAWRDFVMALLVLLALGATAYIWWYEKPPTPRLGLLQTGVVWVVALVGLIGRLQARRKVCRLEAALAYKEIVSARLTPDITEEQSGLGMRHVSAWLVAVLGLAASAALWQADMIERVVGDVSTLAVGATVSVMIALAVAANAVNRLKTRRLTRDFRAALNSERLALDKIGRAHV